MLPYPSESAVPHDQLDLGGKDTEAAFEAADELGLYLQPELPNKRSAFKAPESEDAAQHNIDRLDLNLIAFRMRDRDYFRKTLDLLGQRRVYSDTLWSYGVYHNDEDVIREYLPLVVGPR